MYYHFGLFTFLAKVFHRQFFCLMHTWIEVVENFPFSFLWTKTFSIFLKVCFQIYDNTLNGSIGSPFSWSLFLFLPQARRWVGTAPGVFRCVAICQKEAWGSPSCTLATLLHSRRQGIEISFTLWSIPLGHEAVQPFRITYVVLRFRMPSYTWTIF